MITCLSFASENCFPQQGLILKTLFVLYDNLNFTQTASREPLKGDLLSRWHMLSLLFHHWSIRCIIHQRGTTRPYLGLVFHMHARTSRPECGNPPDLDQDWWLTTCQNWYTMVVSWRRSSPASRCIGYWRQTRLRQCRGSPAADHASAVRLGRTACWLYSPGFNENEVVTAEFWYRDQDWTCWKKDTCTGDY